MRVRTWREGLVWRATSIDDRGSARLGSMMGANGLVLVPAGPAGFKASEEADVVVLSELSEEE